jgi:hypothetical protein
LTIEEVAKSIGYSRVHLTKEMKKEASPDMERILIDKYKAILQNDSNGNQNDKYHFEADTSKLVSEMIEQVVAVTAKQNILTPIIYELYAAHRNEMMTRVVNEVDNMIASEVKRLLEIIQQKWK